MSRYRAKREQAVMWGAVRSQQRKVACHRRALPHCRMGGNDTIGDETRDQPVTAGTAAVDNGIRGHNVSPAEIGAVPPVRVGVQADDLVSDDG